VADGVWICCDVIIGEFLLVGSSAFPKVPGEVVEPLFAQIVEHETGEVLEVFETLFELMDFSFEIKEVLKPFFNGGIWNGEVEEDVSFLEIGSSVVKFEIVNGKDVVGDEVVDE